MIVIVTSLYSSVAEHWSCKPGVESSNLSEGFSWKKWFPLFLRFDFKIGLRIFSRVAQRKRAGPITQRSVDRNHPLLRTHFRPTMKKTIRHPQRWMRISIVSDDDDDCLAPVIARARVNTQTAKLGVEPWASRTLSANPTTSPNDHHHQEWWRSSHH